MTRDEWLQSLSAQTGTPVAAIAEVLEQTMAAGLTEDRARNMTEVFVTSPIRRRPRPPARPRGQVLYLPKRRGP